MEKPNGGASFLKKRRFMQSLYKRKGPKCFLIKRQHKPEEANGFTNTKLHTETLY